MHGESDYGLWPLVIINSGQKEEIELEAVGSLVSKGLKEKIEANARELNFLPKQAQLPI